MAFTFFELHDRGANSAVISYQKTVDKLIGSFVADDMLRRFAAYERGTGHSMISNFKLYQATVYERDQKSVDLNKIENDFIWNGRTAEDLAEFYANITQLKTQRLRMQIYPKTHIIESEPINYNDAILAGEGDSRLGLASLSGEDSFVQPMLASETYEHNMSFIQALQNIKNNGIVFKRTRWDGGINEDDDGNDLTIDLPAYCQYTTENAYLSVNDLVKMRAQMKNNMTDAPELMRPVMLVMSPNTAADMIINNNDRDNLLHSAVFGNRADIGQLPQAYGFSFYEHPLCPDNEVFAITPGVTLKVFDWGTSTRAKEDANIWDVNTIRRRPNYGVKVVQPLSYLAVTINGKTDEYDDSRIDNITTTSDEPLKPIRKKS